MTVAVSALPTAPDAGAMVAGLVATLGLWRARRLRTYRLPAISPPMAGEASEEHDPVQRP